MYCRMYSAFCIFAQLEEHIKELEGQQSDLTPQQQRESEQDDDVSLGLYMCMFFCGIGMASTYS